MKKAFFFDRDGVLVKSIYRFEEEYSKKMDCAPLKKDEVSLVKDAKEIIAYVKEKGFIPIIVTNQSDFLKKNLSLRDYEEITTYLCRALDIERKQVFECLHKPGFSLECGCRKPKHGLILMAQGMFDIDLKNSWMIGDSWKDILVATSAGIINSVFIEALKIENIQEGNQDSVIKMKEANIIPKYKIKNLSEIKKLL